MPLFASPTNIPYWLLRHKPLFVSPNNIPYWLLWHKLIIVQNLFKSNQIKSIIDNIETNANIIQAQSYRSNTSSRVPKAILSSKCKRSYGMLDTTKECSRFTSCGRIKERRKVNPKDMRHSIFVGGGASNQHSNLISTNRNLKKNTQTEH